MVFSRLIVLSPLFILSSLAHADVAPPTPQSGELALEGEVGALDGLAGQLTLRANRFELPGGRASAISPAKIKKIALSKAQILDLRTGNKLPLSDLHLTQKVRIVGKEGKSNTPFQARIITWKSPTPSAQGDGDEGFAPPAIEALLPPSQSFKRFNLRMIDAGFATPSSMSDEGSGWLANSKWTGFFLSYRTRSPRGSRPGELVKFNGLYAPDGTIVSDQTSIYGGSNTPFVGRTMFFRNVNPAWKSVRAEFEVQDPDSGEGTNGIYTDDVTLSDIVLPVRDAANPNKEAASTPNLVYTSPRGNKYTLARITTTGSENYQLQWDYVPVAGVEDLKPEIQQLKVTRGGSNNGGGWNNSNRMWNRKSLETYLWNIPKETKTIDVSFRLKEQSRAWRQPSAFKTLSFDLPIESIFKVAPVTPRKPPSAPIIVKGEKVEARWETDGSNYNDVNGTLWLRDLNPQPMQVGGSKLSTVWRPREVEGYKPDGKKLDQIWLNGGQENIAFRSDNTLRDATETTTPQYIQIGNGNNRLPSIELRYKVERCQEVSFPHRFDGIPLPAPGQKRDFKPDDFSDDTFALRRIVWVRDKSEIPENKRGRFNDRDRGMLLVTFERTRLFPDGDFDTDDVRAVDETGRRELESYSSNGDDPLGELTGGNLWTIQLEAPFTASKKMDFSMRATERKWSGQTEKIAIPNIIVPPNSNG